MDTILIPEPVPRRWLPLSAIAKYPKKDLHRPIINNSVAFPPVGLARRDNYYMHPAVRYAEGVLNRNKDEKLLRWYHFLELIRSGIKTTIAKRRAKFFHGWWHVWVHMDADRAKEYAEAIGERTQRGKIHINEVHEAIQLLATHHKAEALKLARIAQTKFHYFLTLHPDLRAEYELVVGRPYKWHRALTNRNWEEFFDLLSVYGSPWRAACMVQGPFSLSGSVGHRMAHDPDFKIQVEKIWKQRTTFPAPFPKSEQVAHCLALLPEVGKIEKACALVDVKPATLNSMRALNLHLEQQVVEQLREYDRRAHPKYQQWSDSDEAHQPFQSLYHQTHVRESAYQLCLQQQDYEDLCFEARLKVDPKAHPTFAERHGLVVSE